MVSNDLPMLVIHGGDQLHPETCASSVRWAAVAKQTRSAYKGKEAWARDFDARIDLSDCSHQITWSCGQYGGGAPAMLRKIDVAIAELRKARKAVVAVSKFYDKLRETKSDGAE